MRPLNVELRLRVELPNARFLPRLLRDLNIALRKVALKTEASFVYDGQTDDGRWIGSTTLSSYALDLLRDLSWLELSRPTQTKLVAAGIHRVGKLLRSSKYDLLATRGIGPKTVDEIVKVLEARHLALREPCPHSQERREGS